MSSPCPLALHARITSEFSSGVSEFQFRRPCHGCHCEDHFCLLARWCLLVLIRVTIMKHENVFFRYALLPFGNSHSLSRFSGPKGIYICD
ncbi:hypothetical protein MPTK1_2g20770 [Marchantia polymorpha subsp. ruderalis]|uniref:Uncharacterized protein n=1 Tax=Marchantia polymorpha TaxID=3197 RepID=A0A2R6X2Z1_MARPO|nr:hypothetical protein MARPO_0040s0136 [Marchantia polymorpha]BBN03102.1 hypothetical protein Mp_2g20770 [Marchantia polymorpha subsp. ruderalis]|eukprot:PTQ40474.1 hypothetical protein MARPO_0040s0136 [Marchantia polymorpha]